MSHLFECYIFAVINWNTWEENTEKQIFSIFDGEKYGLFFTLF